MRLTGIATRAFNTPLMIEQRKLEVIIQQVILPRLGTAAPQLDAAYLGDSPSERKSYAVTADGIAVIEVSDTLVRKATGLDAWSGLTSYEQLRAELSDATSDSHIKGVLLDIDSPGGEVSGLFDLADFIYSLRGSKPIYAACEMACSAAYAIASAADKVFVTRTGCLGSIGVVCCHVDQSGLDKKLGVDYSYIFAGAKKVDGNPHEPLSDRARETFQAEIDRVYDMFVATVSRNRGIGEKAIRGQEAGVYFGDEGVAAKLADKVGSQDDAMSALVASVDKSGATPKSAKLVGRAAEIEAPIASAADTQPVAEVSADVPEPVAVASTLNPGAEMAKPEDKIVAERPVLDTQAGKKGKADDQPCMDKPSDTDEDEFPEDDDDQEDKKKGRKAKVTEQKVVTETPALSAAEITAVKELCELAGHKEKAIDFVVAGKTADQVLKELHALRSEQSAQSGILSLINPNRGNGIKAMLAEAATYAREKGVTKQQAFTQMLEANPALYADHKRAHQAKALAFQFGQEVELG